MLSFILILNFCAIQVVRVESQITYRDKYLVGPVFERRNTRDWMQCLTACTTSSDCVSYNFEPRSGTCELLIEGLDLGRDCNGEKSLVHSQGWIFHQIIDTFWSSWSQWTQYTADRCDGAIQDRRERSCISSSNSDCNGENIEIRSLPQYQNGELCSWSQWCACRCIDGVQKQTRMCTGSTLSGEKSDTCTNLCSDHTVDNDC